MIRKLYVMVVLLVGLTAGPAALYAQESEEEPVDTTESPKLDKVILKAGIYGGYAYHLHQASENVFSSGAECGAFGDGEGQGYTGSAFFEVPIMGELLDLYGSAGYTSRGGELGETVVGGLPILDPNTDEYTTLKQRHTYEADLTYLRTQLGVRLTLPWFPLFIRGAAVIDFPQTTTFVQESEIVDPTGVVYPKSNQAVREIASGDLVDPESLIAASGTLGYELPIATRLSLAPELTYLHPFSNVTLNREWKIASFEGGLALRVLFGPLEKGPEPLPAPPLPPAGPQTPPSLVPPVASLAVESPRQLAVQKTIVTETFPILPYVFFDSASSEIPGRYERLTAATRDGFDEEAMTWNSLEAYHELLNVIGNRMAEDESISIRVNGTTDGRENSGDRDLARERAKSVRDYMVEVWGVDANRIDVSTTRRPQFPSSTEYEEGFAENRRVEIYSNDASAIGPVVHERFNEYSYRPDRVRLNLGGTSTTDISEWDLTVRAGEEVVYQSSGSGTPPQDVEFALDQDVSDRIASGIEGEGELSATLEVSGRNGLDARTSANVPTEVSLTPYEVSRLSLIVFDYDKSEITPQNRDLVTRFVSEAVGDGSTLTIVGSTDRLGELEHNEDLSKARADAVRDIIRTTAPEAEITDIRGVGPRLRFDNNVPEGRYYCRTVTVEVKTPLTDEE